MVGFKTRKDGRVYPTGQSDKAAVQPVVFARNPKQLSDSDRKRLSVSMSPRRPNSEVIDELEFYTMQQSDLYKNQFVPIVNALERRREKGTYDRDKARVAFLNLVENASRKYDREEASSGRRSFSKADKLVVAGRLERSYVVESDLGNYKNMVV